MLKKNFSELTLTKTSVADDSIKLKKLNTQLLEWKTLMKSKVSPVKLLIDLVKYPVINEKSFFIFYKKQQYTFDVDLRLTKPQIKKLFENLFEVNIVAINTHIPPRKKVRRVSVGYKPQYKRVILTLKENQFINYL